MKALNGATVPMGILTITFLAMYGGWKTLDTKTLNNEKEIHELKKTPFKVAKIETEIVNIKEDVGDIRMEQRVMRTEMNNSFKEILRKMN